MGVFAIVFSVYLTSLQTMALDHKNEHWQWVIDGTPSELDITSAGVRYESPTHKVTLPNKPCAKKIIRDIQESLRSKVDKAKTPKSVPEDASPIYLTKPDGETIPVLRGTPLGLFLLDYAAHISRMERLKTLACKK